jgi:hypothetical protein
MSAAELARLVEGVALDECGTRDGQDLRRELRLCLVWAAAGVAALADEHEADVRRCVDKLREHATTAGCIVEEM